MPLFRCPLFSFVSSAFSSRIVAALEKPIGAKFRSNKQKVVNVVVANKRSVKSENEDLIVAVLVVSRSRFLPQRLRQKQRSNAKGEDDFGEKEEKREKREASWIGFNTLNFIEAKFQREKRNLHKERRAKDDDDARWWRSFFSVLSSRVVRPSPTQRGFVVVFVFVVVEEKGFEYSEYDDDSDERSDFGIDDDAMLFVLFVVFKLEGDE